MKLKIGLILVIFSGPFFGYYMGDFSIDKNKWFVFNNSVHSSLTNSEWAGFLGSYIGGIFGGIATLIAILINISFTRKTDDKKEILRIIPVFESKFDKDSYSFRITSTFDEEKCRYKNKFKLEMPLINIGSAPAFKIKPVLMLAGIIANREAEKEYIVSAKGTKQLSFNDISLYTDNPTDVKYKFTLEIKYEDLLGTNYIQNLNFKSLSSSEIDGNYEVCKPRIQTQK